MKEAVPCGRYANAKENDGEKHAPRRITPRRAAPAGIPAMLRYDATDILAGIEIPVLVVVGDRDPVTKPEASRQIQQAVLDGHLFVMKPSKHLGLLEHNEEFSRVVNNFCAGVAKAQETAVAK